MDGVLQLETKKALGCGAIIVSQIQMAEPLEEEAVEDALAPGTSLLRGQYEIIRFLNSGGFGITYLARDSLERDVVVKECFPSALCVREGDRVVAQSENARDDLSSIIKLFIQEARNHAKLIHPNIVPVHQVFEDNDTAYIAMDYVRGCDLLDYMDQPDTSFTVDEFVALTEKMLSAVSFIHEHGMLHRDISPDNILINQDGEPILIDFGAARDQAAHRNAALVTLRVVKDGYSPQEFYVPGSVQGPYSDLYVLAATLYHVLTGEPPADGKTRFDAYDKQVVDPYVPVTGRFENFPPHFLEALDQAMKVMPAQRLQSALEWLQMFRGPGAVFGTMLERPPSVIAALDEAQAPENAEPANDAAPLKDPALIEQEVENADAAIAAMLADTSPTELQQPEPAEIPQDSSDKVVPLKTSFEESVEAEPEEDGATAVFSELEPPEESAKEKSKTGIYLIGVAAVALIAGAGFFMIGGSGPEEIAAPVESNVVVAPAVATAAVETPAVPVETATAVAEDLVADDAETLAAAPAEPAADVKVLADQVAFSHWDVDVPFEVKSRRLSNGSVYIVESVDANAPTGMIGPWIRRGTSIYSVNNRAAGANTSLASLLLSDLQIGQDGYTRATARYKLPGQTRFETGQIALPVVKQVGLKTGAAFAVSGAQNWQVSVTRTSGMPGDELRVGDVLIREENTGMFLNQRGAMTSLLQTLAAQGNIADARFTVNRNGAEVFARMPLMQE